MFRLTTYSPEGAIHHMILFEGQLRINVCRADSESNPAKQTLNNWINGLAIFEDPSMYIGKDFYDRKITVEVLR